MSIKFKLEVWRHMLIQFMLSDFVIIQFKINVDYILELFEFVYFQLDDEFVIIMLDKVGFQIIFEGVLDLTEIGQLLRTFYKCSQTGLAIRESKLAQNKDGEQNRIVFVKFAEVWHGYPIAVSNSRHRKSE